MITVRRATNDDIDPILDLLKPYVIEGIILERTASEILGMLDTFFVACDGDKVIGTVSYHNYGPELKEVRSLAVSKSSQKTGAGRLLVEELIKSLKNENPCAKIFTLTYLPDFFKKLGFHVVDMETLPEKIWKDCSKCPKQECCKEIALVYSL